MNFSVRFAQDYGTVWKKLLDFYKKNIKKVQKLSKNNK